MNHLPSQQLKLHKSTAHYDDDKIVIRPSPATLIGPVLQGCVTGVALLVLVLGLNTHPLWLLGTLLTVIIIFGPTTILSLVYAIAGTNFLMEKEKSTCRVQQKYFGLGIGTREMIPFNRIDRFQIEGDYLAEHASGDLRDIVSWQIILIKDNQKQFEIANLSSPRSLALATLENANNLGSFLATMSQSNLVKGQIPSWALDD
ncbi:MAG: hypothetical protein VYB76_03435 [Chloroflexota bacterium]|nr:hypothetical protein [Chloroflexota bacterium]